MPIYQSVGIVIGAVATILGLPRLFDDVTNSARLEKKLDLMQRLADNAVLPGVKHVMTNKSAELSKRLAAIYAIPNDRRVVVDLGMGITWLVIGTVVLPRAIDDFDLPKFDGIRPVYWLFVYAGVWFTLRGLIRHRTVRLNRRLYMELGGPIDPPVLHAPPLRRVFQRGAVTLGRIMKTAKANWQINPGVTLTEHVRSVINDLEHGRKLS